MKIANRFFVLIFALAFWVFAADFPITQYPTWLLNPSDNVSLKWANFDGQKNEKIYFGRNPGVANASNRDSITRFVGGYDSHSDGQTSVRFVPSQNPNLRPGINYLVISDGVRFSNEVKIILKHSDQNKNLKPSGDLLDSKNPQFSWTKPAGVPYSHIMLSDENVNVFGIDGQISLESIKGTSIIWQAITPNSRISYGEPDPSGIFTTAPPPLSPGKTYTWFVFNNYGNNPAYTPTNDMVLPAAFTLNIDKTKKIPENFFPANKAALNDKTNPEIEFKWKNLDANALIYRVLVYTKAGIAGIDAQLLVWSADVSAGQFKGRDTASLKMSAKDVLSRNEYLWRVVTISATGNGQAGNTSGFSYDVPSGIIKIHAIEEMNFGGRRFTQDLGLAQVEVETISGSREADVSFFTGVNGWADRIRAVGTHKITVRKDGYESDSKIVSISDKSVTEVEFTLRRPFASIYGKITDQNANPVNLARISAVSDDRDSVRTFSLPDGNFVLNCQPKNWAISVSKQGFANSDGNRVVLRNNENLNRNFQINRNLLTLSGIVKNEKKEAVFGAALKILYLDSVGTHVAALISTPGNGRFSFTLAPGKYEILAVKSGLVSYSDTITLSASQDREIILKSGAAILQGTLYGESWFAKENTLEKKSAAVVNAKVEVIDANSKKIVATSATDDIYGTYSIGVPASSAKYLLSFSAQGFVPCSVLTASDAIKDGNTYSQDVKIQAFASISGNVFDRDANAAADISVSLVRNGVSFASVRTDRFGEFSFFRIPDGKYVIFANGNGQTKDFVEQIASESGASVRNDTATIKNGIFYSGENTKSVSINITMKPANSKIVLFAQTEKSAGKDNSVAINIYSPFSAVLENDTLRGVSADPSIKYLASAAPSSNALILDCVEKPLSFPAGAVDGDVLAETILMPFRYAPNAAADTLRTTLKLSTWTGIDSAFVYYRHAGETGFDEKLRIRGSLGANEISFAVEPKKPGSNIEFYFTVYANSAIYSNKTHPYVKFVAAKSSHITRWEVLPARDSIILALNGRMNVSAKAYYGADFREVSLTSDKIDWYVRTNRLGISKDDKNPSALITGKSAGTDLLVVKIKLNSNLTLENGVKDSIVVPVRITDSEVASLKVVCLSELVRPEYITNKESVIFGTEARDKNGNLVAASPTWILSPKTAGKIDDAGLFIPDTNFIGRVYVAAQINSKIRDEFYLNGKRGILVAHAANTDAKKVGNEDIDLNFDKNAVKNSPIIVSVDKLEWKNSVEREVEGLGIFMISDVFEVKREIGGDFETPSPSPRSKISRAADAISDPVKITLDIPQIYHGSLTKGSADTSKLGVAVWDDNNLRWEYDARSDSLDTLKNIIPPKPHYDPEKKTLTVGISKYINGRGKIRVGIIGKGLGNDSVVSVSPNPFSPFVSPLKDYMHIEDMRSEVKGTCIRITPKSSNTAFKHSAQVTIYTADNVLVYRASLSGLSPEQSYYLFWDGRKQLSQEKINKLNLLPNRALFMRGDELCRNGRYFVNVTIDDEKDKKRYTKEIILFK